MMMSQYLFKQLLHVCLVVQISSDLREAALSLHDILDGGGLHEEGIAPVSLDNLVRAS